MDNDATFSPDRRYRYRLVRDWREDPDEAAYRALRKYAGDMLHMCCLNPSTADEMNNDPTVRRCISFAKTLGFGGLVLTNLFAYRATDPTELYRSDPDTSFPVGEQNDDYIITAAQESRATILAWGNHGKLNERGARLLLTLKRHGIRLYAFGETKTGQPKHPLYLRADSRPIPWGMDE